MVDSCSSAKTEQGMTDSPRQPLVTPPRERQADIVDVEACLERSDAITLGMDAATPPRWTIVAAMDDVNHTPSPQMTLADRRLNRFTKRVTKARQPPLLELPGDEVALGGCAPPSLSLPKRSRRIAAQAIAHIPTAKRGEYRVMKRLGFSSGIPPSSPSAMTYNEVFNGDSAHIEALLELFPLVGDIGPRKRGRRPASRE